MGMSIEEMLSNRKHEINQLFNAKNMRRINADNNDN